MPPLLPDFISTSVCKLKVRKIVDTTKRKTKTFTPVRHLDTAFL